MMLVVPWALVIWVLAEKAISLNAGFLSSSEGNNSTSKSFLNGRYTTTSDLGDAALITLDMRDIVSSPGLDGQAIYEKGKNAGQSLQAMALSFPNELKDEPYYQFFVYAAKRNPAIKSEALTYADSIITHLFSELLTTKDDTSDDAMAGDAIVAILFWMQHVHYLYQALNACELGSDADVPQYLDRAFALYVGEEQLTGDASTGYSLYNLAEKMASFFSTENPNTGEASVNERIVMLYTDLQNDFVLNNPNNACENDPIQVTKRLQAQVQKIIHLTSVPIVQALLHYLNSNQPVYAEIHALQLIPLMGMCSRTHADTFQSILVSQPYNSSAFPSLLQTLQVSFDCLGITCADVGAYETNAIPACVDQTTANLAGFITSADVREPSKIDRDIYQMSILLSQNAFKPARSIYLKGMNSMVKDTRWTNTRFSQSSSTNSPHSIYQSLRDLAEDDRRINTVPYYQNFMDYSNDRDYGNEIITMLETRQDPYSQDTPLDQIASGAVTASMAIITHHAALQHFYTAYQTCDKYPDNEQAILAEWDTGVAYVIGSMEESGGTTEGQLMYALAKSTCSTFGTCQQLTEALFGALRQGPTENYYIGSCESIRQAASNVTGVLQTILIQATIKSALDNKSTRSASGYILATALMPILLTYDKAAAEVIEKNMMYSDNLGSDIDAVWGAFTAIIPKMTTVTCSLIGTVSEKPSLCSATSTAQSSSHKGVNLAGYIPTTDVTYVLNWSEDTKEMLSANTPEEAEALFLNGKNTKRPLKNLSVSADEKMRNEPIFNIYRYSLAQIGPLTEGKENGVSSFAKTIISDVFLELGNETKSYYSVTDMAVEAVQLNILFMEVIHGLYSAAVQCSIGRVSGVAEALDGAAAFYVGVDQKIGDKNTGYSMYHLAEKMGEIYGTTKGNISLVNDFVMKEFDVLKNTFILNSTCPQNPASASQLLMSRINEMVNKMKVVTVQSFLYYLSQRWTNYIELYAIHVTPMISTCSYELSEEFENTFIKNHSYTPSMFSDILGKLQSIYSCLGISCTDIGFIEGKLEQCKFSFSPSVQPFQSVIRVNRLINDRYITLTDQTDFSDILDDIRDVVNAPSVATAKNIFENGKNAKSANGTILTLASLSLNAASRMVDDMYYNATLTTLGLVPALADENDIAPDYAYKIISDIFTELSDTYGDTSDDAMAGEALIVTLVSMEIWHHLDEAVRQCKKSTVTVDGVALAIDQAAMLYVGLNQSYGSAQTGYSFYRLAEFLADFFGTYSSEGESSVNSDVVLAFDNIKRNFLLSDYCIKNPTKASSDLAHAVSALISKMKVVLVQGLLKYLGDGEYNYSELYALVVSPLISMCDKSVSYSLIDKLVKNKASFAASMLDSIVSDIQSTYKCLGITCDEVGAYSDADGIIIVPQCYGNDTIVKAESSPVNFAGYNATMNVTHVLNLYEDVKEMSDTNSSESAKQIFLTGIHAGEMPLANYSLRASSEMFNEPIFNMFRYSLSSIVPLSGKDKVIDSFAKSIILDVLDETVSYYGAAASDKFAAEAVKLNIFFMEVIHSLFSASYQCSLGNTQAVAQALDEAVAFYVGPSQAIGDDFSGYSLYNLAEKMGTLFDTVSNSNTSLVNAFVINEFIQLRDDFVTAKSCEIRSDSASNALVQRSNKIINKMKATSIQGLIHFMYQNQTYYTELYALHMTPLVALCDYALSEELKRMLIDQQYNSTMFNEILSKLEGIYSCLGIGCSDVGFYKGELHQRVYNCTPSIDDYRQPFTDVIRINRLISDRYMTLTDQSDFAKILDDIRDVVNAPTAAAAREIFNNGKNAIFENGANVSLSSLSTSAANRYGNSRYFDAFQTTLATIPAFQRNTENLVPDYANQIVSDVFSELVGTYYDDPTDNALAGEALILTLVSMEIWHYLDEAVIQCGNSSSVSTENVAIAIDRAAMMYVGMGQTYGSSTTGYSFYRLAEYVSNDFGTNSSDKESVVNSEILLEFDNIKRNFSLSTACLRDPVTASRQLQLATENIIEKMIVVMVQGFMKYLISKELKYAELYALQIAPLASLCNQSVALDVIEKFVTKKSSLDNITRNVVVAEIQGLYDCWGIECDDVGSYKSFSDVLPSCQSGPICFIGYCPTTPIHSSLGFMEDLRDIANAETAVIAQKFFSSGKNRGDGEALSSLSAKAEVEMAVDPYYNMFKYSLANVDPLANSASGISAFGETIVLSVFKDLQEYYDDKISDSMAAEAIVLHIIFFEIVRNLIAASRYCKAGDTAKVEASLDEAVIFYVGVDQQAGDSYSGYSWYNLAERMAVQFGTKGDSGSSAINEFFIGKMTDLKQFYTKGNNPCSSYPTNSSVALLQSVQEIVDKLKVVSLQGLIHYMNVDEKYFVELYALHFTPFVSVCDFSLSEELEKKLIVSASDLEASVFDDILGKVQASYSCMGISCSDVGGIDESQQSACTFTFDPSAQPYSDVMRVDSLLKDRYTTLTDQADFGGILDDIRDVVNANSISDAKAVFYDGKNAKEKNGAPFTLASLSTTSEARMKKNKYYEAYQSTLGLVPSLSNSNKLAPIFGYEIVGDIFAELAETLGDISDDAMAGEALILSIVSMEIWNYLDMAVSHCGDSTASTVEEVAFAIDRAAMLYIGKNQTYGSDKQGYSFYRLAEFVSNNFDTMSPDGESFVNSVVLEELNGIKQNFVMSKACLQSPITASRQLQIATEGIIAKMKVVMVQGLLLYMAENQINFSELYALHVAPLVSLCNKTLSNDLLEKFVLKGNKKYVPSMLSSTISEIQAQYTCLGITCADVGSYTDASGHDILSDCTDLTTRPAVVLAGYRPSTNVDSLLNTTLDVAAIRLMVNLTEAKFIYENGMNSFDSDGALVALADWSRYADWDMSAQPYFNFFKYALLRVGALSSNNDVSNYAGSIVQDIFLELGTTLGDKSDDEMAAEAIVITHYWMRVVRHLYDAVSGCEEGNATIVTAALDFAVATYVGLDQSVGDEKTGHVLYNLAEKMSVLFGTETQNNSTSQVNHKIMILFTEIQTLSQSCANSTSTASQLHFIVNQIIHQMTIPLVQGLIYYMELDNEAEVELYALQITPLIATCSEVKYTDLQDLLILSSTGYTSDMKPQVLSILNGSFSCLGIACKDIGSFKNYTCDLTGLSNASSGIKRIVGFELSNDVDEELKLDLDIHQISMLLSVGAFTAAESIINRGQNSIMSNSTGILMYRSIKSLISPELYNFIFNITNQDQPFDKISAQQTKGLVTETMRSMAGYHASLVKLNDAVETCSDNSGTAEAAWEGSLAYLVGSMEGPESGGDFSESGQMMYALAKKNCFAFNTCAKNSDSKLNVELLDLFSRGKDALARTSCSDVSSIADRIKGVLLTIFIQGTLNYALLNADLSSDSESEDLAKGYIITQALYPSLADADPTNAGIIEWNMQFPVANSPVPDGSDAVFTAFATVIPRMKNVSCADVGNVTYNGFVAGVCPVNDGNASTADPQGLSSAMDNSVDLGISHVISNGLYTTSSNVGDRINIAEDVWDISKALESKNINLARSIYREGLNSEMRDNEGVLLMKKRNIADFSLMAGQAMSQDLPFNIFKYALQDNYGYYRGSPVEQYADTFVESAFDNTILSSLAAEAIVALNIWMAVVHELYDQVNQCKREAVLVTGIRRLEQSYGPLPVDIAAAYYIGDGQQTGSSKSGHMLYRLAEEAGERFGQDSVGTGEAEINTKVLAQFNKIKGQIAFADACTAKSNTVATLRVLVDNTVSYMTVPLIQNLIHAMKDNDPYRVQLYALSIIPLIAGCNEATYAYLRSTLIDNDYDPSKFNDILPKIQGSYMCLGISCGDVGVYRGGVVPECQDPSDENVVPLAGYLPISNVYEQSEIDLDIQQIKILVSMGALEAADDLYIFGRNSRRPLDGTSNGLLSLHSIATDPTVVSAPSLKIFSDYYNSNTFADTLVTKIFASTEPFKELTLQQKSVFVSTALNVLVMYMFTIAMLDTAISDCNAADINRNAFGATGIDLAAAAIIGSIEGSEERGSPENVGVLMYGLSKTVCNPLHTCAPNGDSQANDRLGILLSAAQTQLTAFSCVSLSHTVSEIQTVLVSILLQSLIYSVSLLGKADVSSSTSKNIMELNTDISDDKIDFINAYLYTLALAPMVEKANSRASFLLAAYMAFDNLLSQPEDMKWPVFYAVADAVADMPDVDCSSLGYVDGMDACNADRSHLTMTIAKLTQQPSSVAHSTSIGRWVFLSQLLLSGAGVMYAAL